MKIRESSALLCNTALYTVISSWNGHSTSLHRSRCKIILMIACCLSHTYFFCQTWFTANQIYHVKSGKGRRLLSFPPFTFHRAQHKEWQSFISTDYTKLACYYNSTTEHMLNFLCIHNVLGSNKAEQYSLQYFLTYQDNKEPCKLSNRCLLLRYVFNHRRTNLINWEFLLCISSCCLWCLQWRYISAGFYPTAVN